MDKRSWPWKKKSSEKQAVEKALASVSDSSAAASDERAANKKPKYVQISMESYTHLTRLEDQVKSYEEQVKSYEEQVQSLEDEVKDLNEKLSEAQSEMTEKENLVKQHAKVAEEAVSGWEKAEAEAATLKNHLESVTLLKLTAEDRATHLDGALKECMRQIRNLKEEHEQKLQEVVLNKTKLFDKMKLELEAKISNLDQQLLRSASDNAALSRSLQDRSNMLIKLSEEKSQAEGEIERLKSDIESCEKNVNSLKYELHIARKEAEIRNEEKNMSVRSAEVANKQHLEGVKKIAKLEAECQRLRGLVRKKLPGPAALAQMKLEVENLGNYGESRLRRSPVKTPEFSDYLQKYQKENEMLTERLIAMDEETKMLKEALAKRNSELQTSRNIFEQTAGKLQSLEAQIETNGKQKTPRSCVALSEDGGNDDNVSCAGSWATESMSEFSYVKKGKDGKSEKSSQLELMDDFLEMEKLANLPQESKEDASAANNVETGSSQELDVAISNIYDFVMILGKEANSVPGTCPEGGGLKENLDIVSDKYREATSKRIKLVDFVLDVSRVLSKASALHFNVLGFKSSEVETNGSDCIDKIALPENKAVVDSSGERYPNGAHFSDTASDPDVPNDGNLVPTSESTWKCSLEEFEQLKMDKDNVEDELSTCRDNFENAKSKLVETEEILADVKSQLTAAQKSNTLAETQLKCMAESYNSLEKRAEELQTEVNHLQGKIESLDKELQEERRNHQDALTRCKDLQEELQRVESSAADNGGEGNQEKELAAAAEKLAECQETIYLLGKQLKSLRPQPDFLSSPNNVKIEKEFDVPIQEVSTRTSMNLQEFVQFETDNPDSYSMQRAGSESPLDLYNSTFTQSDSEQSNPPLRSPSTTKQQAKHRPTKSGSSSASSTPTPEKHARGFSRFFSPKGKNA